MINLKGMLKLTNVSNADSQRVIDRAVQLSRIRIYKALGKELVDNLTSVTYSDSPGTDEGIDRLTAGQLEVSFVRMFLLRELPHFWVNSSPDQKTYWNDSGFSLPQSQEEHYKELNRLKSDIEQMISDLLGYEADDSILNIMTIGPEVTPDPPGYSIRNSSSDSEVG